MKKIEEKKEIIVRENGQLFAILYLYLIAFVNSKDPFKRRHHMLFERNAQYTTPAVVKRSKNYNAMVSRQM